MQTIKLECLATANKVTAVIVIVIVIVNLYIYIAPLKEKLLRGAPDPTKPNHDQKGWSSDGCGREADTEQGVHNGGGYSRQSIPRRWTNNGKVPALGRSQPNPGHGQITLLSRTERPTARQR